MSPSLFRRAEVLDLVRAALREDLGRGDPTTQALVAPRRQARASLVARRAGVIAGLPLFVEVLRRVDRRIRVRLDVADGAAVRAGTILARVEGPLRGILSGERTALNFLGRLSGVATLTAQFVAVAPPGVAVLDTRKTTPGWRRLQKYAVRCGGGVNHRMDLADGVMIKDNHLDGLGLAGGVEGLREAVRRARRAAKVATAPLTVEVRTQAEVAAALAADADNLLLDNMTPAQVRAAVARVRRHNRTAQRRVTTELSGGVTLARLRRARGLGVDRVSIGALTHSAPVLDVALDVVPVSERGASG